MSADLYIAAHPSELGWTPHPAIPRTWVKEDGVTLFVFPPRAPIEVLVPAAEMRIGRWDGVTFTETTA